MLFKQSWRQALLVMLWAAEDSQHGHAPAPSCCHEELWAGCVVFSAFKLLLKKLVVVADLWI